MTRYSSDYFSILIPVEPQKLEAVITSEMV
jgi:hypothetical protein